MKSEEIVETTEYKELKDQLAKAQAELAKAQESKLKTTEIVMGYDPVRGAYVDGKYGLFMEALADAIALGDQQAYRLYLLLIGKINHQKNTTTGIIDCSKNERDNWNQRADLRSSTWSGNSETLRMPSASEIGKRR